MRNLPNETAVERLTSRHAELVSASISQHTQTSQASEWTLKQVQGDGKHTPERRCILSGEHAPKAALIRLALGPDGTVAPDIRARAPGRGAWIGVDRTTLEAAQAKGKLKGALTRAFKTSVVTIPEDLASRIEGALARTALDRLGIEARGGALVFGGEKIEQAARSGTVYALLHAADAGTDGNGKLDQAWRVGQEREGSALKGLVLAADRTILSAALGRENIVHIALTDKAAAARVMALIRLWHGFVGRGFIEHEMMLWPCATPLQGSSATANNVFPRQSSIGRESSETKN
jgi:predicted RNA-binding protein YlxR (DUF448 family)